VRRAGRVLLAAALLEAAGCGAAAEARAPAETGPRGGRGVDEGGRGVDEGGRGVDEGGRGVDEGGWITAPPSSAAPSPPRTLAAAGPVTLGAPAPKPEPARPPRRPRVSVNLKDADLPDALRLLAEVGGFGVVVESDVAGTVSVRLSEVDPFEALETLAQANGAEARYERGIVVVRRRGP